MSQSSTTLWPDDLKNAVDKLLIGFYRNKLGKNTVKIYFNFEFNFLLPFSYRVYKKNLFVWFFSFKSSFSFVSWVPVPKFFKDMNPRQLNTGFFKISQI